MEYYTVARALKSSLRRELPMMMKSSIMTQQSLLDDMFVNNSNSPLVEDFSVDCFFDFSNGGDIQDNSNNNICNIQEPQIHMINVHDDDYDDEEEEKDSVSVSSQEKVHDSFLAVEPIDELAELEWVSRFVDDSSSSELSLLYPIKSQENHARQGFQPEQAEPVALTRPSCLFSGKIPAKSRSRRLRPTGRTWSIDSLLTDMSPSSSSHSSSSSSSSTITTESTACLVTVHNKFEPSLSEPPMKKPKKNQTAEPGGAKGLIQFQRKCSHCQVQKTPQWRTGPLGAKTLCNACGVRYKSGRLFPEYRPACSPTFLSDVHSNSHRKVIEMRKRKETAGSASGLSHMDQSF